MARKLYGNLMNRIGEDRMYCNEIKVGTGMTEYMWSDRYAYEVTAVKDQKHVTVREYEVKNVGTGFENKWELISNPEAGERDLVKVGDFWYWTNTVTADEWLEAKAEMEKGDPRYACSIVCNGFDPEKIMKNGKQTKRTRAKVSFGVADYYYDYEF